MFDLLLPYTLTTLVISLVTDIDRPRPLIIVMFFSATSALCSASSNMAWPLRYLFIVIVTTSSCWQNKILQSALI
jgi:hypothetical protein